MSQNSDPRLDNQTVREIKTWLETSYAGWAMIGLIGLAIVSSLLYVIYGAIFD